MLAEGPVKEDIAREKYVRPVMNPRFLGPGQNYVQQGIQESDSGVWGRSRPQVGVVGDGMILWEA
jgi:hypothetical protein